MYKEMICQVQVRFTTKICFRGNTFRKSRDQTLLLLAQKEIRNNSFLLQCASKKVGIPDEVFCQGVSKSLKETTGTL